MKQLATSPDCPKGLSINPFPSDLQFVVDILINLNH